MQRRPDLNPRVDVRTMLQHQFDDLFAFGLMVGRGHDRGAHHDVLGVYHYRLGCLIFYQETLHLLDIAGPGSFIQIL
jgi:hypothetical protein